MSFFEPLPPAPPPAERRWAPPAWDRPSEGTLPAFFPVGELLHRNAGDVEDARDRRPVREEHEAQSDDPAAEAEERHHPQYRVALPGRDRGQDRDEHDADLHD